MPRYVYSTRHPASLVHVGHPTLCGQAFMRRETTDTIPPGRSMCRRCARLAGIAPVTAQGAPAGQRHADVLALLNSGHTDYAIASRLAVSVATVRRRIADLMADVGARSRWQAGRLAALREVGAA